MGNLALKFKKFDKAIFHLLESIRQERLEIKDGSFIDLGKRDVGHRPTVCKRFIY